VFNNLKNIVKYFDDDILYYSASLSFFTIFSFLPILALIVVIMSSYPLFSHSIDMLMLYTTDFINPVHSVQVTNGISDFLSNIDKLGYLGLFYLIFVWTMFLKDYDHIVNKIHKTKKRSLIPLIFLYLSFLLLIPISLVALNFISTFISNYLIQMMINSLFGFIIFTILFKISINKPISLRAAAISSFLTISLLKITQSIFIYYILYNTTYFTLYGTFSIILFLFLWIYISWSIYLFGIKLCYLLNLRYENEN